MTSTTGILSTGSYLPSTVVGNEEIARQAGVTDEWIVRKTGIRSRHRAAPHEATSDLAAQAARRALEQAGLRPSDLSYIVVATSTPDQPQPATASIVQDLLGARGAACFDINAVCSGFVYALAVAERMLRAGRGDEYCLVVGADVYSRILDYSDRKTAILFGDGAGAVILGPVPEGTGMVETSLVTRGDQHQLIGVPAGGSRLPSSPGTLERGEHFFRMDGRSVRSFVHENLPVALSDLLVKAGVSGDDVDHVIPHQANGVMLNEVWPSLGLTSAALHITLETHGNTGAASVPLTLDTAHRKGLLAEDERILLAAFGGGMSVGAALLTWGPTRYALPSWRARREGDEAPVGMAQELLLMGSGAHTTAH